MGPTRGSARAGSSFPGEEQLSRMKTSDDDEVLAEAAARWTLRLRDETDKAAVAAHAAWLAGGPRRAEAMAEAAAVLDLMDLALAPAVAKSRRARMAGGRSGRRLGSAAAVAAGLAACLVLAVGNGVLLQGARDGVRLSAPIGEIRHHTLADGSQVTLNTDTVLEVRYVGAARNVRLIRGEAFFDVVHDPRRPFVVESRAGRARVLGTAFDVRLRGQAAQVSVLRGAVQVEPVRGGGRGVVLAGQWAWLGEGSPRILAQALEDPVAVDAWRQGRLVIYRRPLSEVVAELNRYRRGRIVVRGAALERTTVSGVFDVARPDAALDALVASLDLRTARLGGFVLVYRPIISAGSAVSEE